MTPAERDLLTRFLSDLTNVPTASRDDEAAALIDRALSSRPDGGYLLVQHAILADQALHAAQARIADLEQQRAAAPERRFLDAGAPSPWGAAPSGTASRGIFSGGPPAAPGGFSSFLQSAATTAAGVAAGDFLFEGLSNLFGGHRSSGFLGGGFGGGFGGGGGVQNIVVNEYNNNAGDDDSDDDSSDFGDSGDDDFNNV